MYAALTYFGQGKLICTSTTTADNGKTVSVTDGKKTWTGVMTNGVCTFILPAKQKYTVKLLNGGTVEYETEVIFGFGDCKELEVGMDKKSWKGLKAILNAGLESEMLAVGDRISATVAGEEQVFDIVHINYRSDVYGRNIILGKHDCLSEVKQMHPTSTNYMPNAPFALEKYLNNDYYDSLPSDVKSVISTMQYKTGIGGGQNNLYEQEQKIWLPLEHNVFGSSIYAAAKESSEGGATQFSYYVTDAKRIKHIGTDGAATPWILGSPFYKNGTGFCGVYSSGVAMTNGIDATTPYGVCPHFMIAADN